MATRIPSRNEAEDMFNQLDVSGDGVLSPAEVIEFLEANKYSHEEAEAIFEELDTSDDKKITLQEFIEEICAKPRREVFEAMFADADSDGSGQLTLEEVKDACANAGLTDKKAIQACFKKMDKDKSGTVDKAEFIEYMDQNY